MTSTRTRTLVSCAVVALVAAVLAVVTESGAPKPAQAVCAGWPSDNLTGYAELDHWTQASPMGVSALVNAGKKSGWVKHSAAVVADVTGDTRPEVLVGSLDGKVYMFDAAGCRVPGWPRTTGAYSTLPGPVNSTPQVGDIDGDGGPEIMVGSENGWVFAWNPDGSHVPGWPQFTGWNADYPQYCGIRVCTGVWASPTIADIDSDRRLDVVVGSWSHLIWAWNGDGSVKPGFPRDVWDGISSTAAVDDIDGDGNLDIVFGSDTANDCSNCQPYGRLVHGGYVHAIRLDGNELPGWPQHQDAFTWSSPSVKDVNGDGSKDVLIGAGLWPGDHSPGPPGNTVTAFDHNGAVIWRFAAVDNVQGQPAVGDLDGNGTQEVAFGDLSGWVYLLDGRNGAQIWRRSSPLVNSHLNSAALADVDGDSYPEIVMAGSNDWHVRAWNRFGTQVWAKNTGFGIFASPTVADLDGSGKTWVIVGTGKGDGASAASPEQYAGTGILYAFKTNGAASATKWAGFGMHPKVTSAASIRLFGIGFGGGAEIATIDVDADARTEVVAGPGPGGGPNVRVVDPLTGDVQGNFLAYGGFTGGVRVATGSFTGAGRKEIATAPGPGGGPNVRVFSATSQGPNPAPAANFMAYHPAFTGGVFVGAADVDGNGVDEVLTGPGAGGGPHLRVWSLTGPGPRVMAETMAYGSFTGGVRVAGGALLGTGQAELIATGPGPGGSADVRVLKVNTAVPGGAGVPWSIEGVTRFQAYPNFFGGVQLGIVPADSGRARDRIATGPGPGGGPDFRMFDVVGDPPQGSLVPGGGFVLAPWSTYGLRVAGGDVDGNGSAERIAAPGAGGLPLARWLP